MTFDNNPSRPPPVDVPARDTAAITATGAISPTEEVRRRWSTSAPPFRPGIDDDDDGGDVPAVLPVQDADHTDPGYAGLHASKGCVGEIKTMADGDMMLDLEKRSDEHTWLRIYALVCACTFGIGSHYAAHMVGPLKDVLKQELGATNAQFSLLQSSLTLFPTILPLVGGIFVERFGAGPSSIAFSSFILLGQVLVLLATWTGNVNGMVGGFMIFGIGSGPIVTVQETILINFFKGQGLSLALGVGLMSGKIASFLASFTAFPLTRLSPFYFHTPFLFSTFLCFCSWLMNIAYLLLLRKVERHERAYGRPDNVAAMHGKHSEKIQWRDVFGFSDLFWWYLGLCFLFGACWQPFMHLSSNIVKHRYGITDMAAAFYASVILAVPVVVYPFLGLFLDRVGKRCMLLLICAATLFICFSLLLSDFQPPALLPLLFFAVSCSLGPLTLVTAVPLLTNHIPTGLGLHKSLDNIGATLMGTIAGVIQDAHVDPNKTDLVVHHEGDPTAPVILPDPLAFYLSHRDDDLSVLRLFWTVSLIAVFSCIVFWYGDIHWRKPGERQGIINQTKMVDTVKLAGLTVDELATEDPDEKKDLDEDDETLGDEEEVMMKGLGLRLGLGAVESQGAVLDPADGAGLGLGEDGQHVEVTRKRVTKGRRIKTLVYIGICCTLMVTAWITFAAVVISNVGEGGVDR